MIIGTLIVKLHISHANSLKAKRQVIKSIKDRLRNRFNVSVAEVDDYDKWQLATVAVANISNDRRHIDSTLNRALNFIENFNDVDILDHQLELL